MEPARSPLSAVASATGIAGLPVRDDLWRGRRGTSPRPALASGHRVLDAVLPAGGWPAGHVCEVLHGHDGVGELQLLLPALARLGSSERPLVWVAPPYRPHAPALIAHGLAMAHLRVIEASPQQALWAAEQCLRAGCCAAVLLWPARIDATALRRLQLAAETGASRGFVFRDAAQAARHSPLPIRLVVRRQDQALRVHVLKCRGLLAPPAAELVLA